MRPRIDVDSSGWICARGSWHELSQVLQTFRSSLIKHRCATCGTRQIDSRVGRCAARLAGKISRWPPHWQGHCGARQSPSRANASQANNNTVGRLSATSASTISRCEGAGGWAGGRGGGPPNSPSCPNHSPSGPSGPSACTLYGPCHCCCVEPAPRDGPRAAPCQKRRVTGRPHLGGREIRHTVYAWPGRPLRPGGRVESDPPLATAPVGRASAAPWGGVAVRPSCRGGRAHVPSVHGSPLPCPSSAQLPLCRAGHVRHPSNP